LSNSQQNSLKYKEFEWVPQKYWTLTDIKNKRVHNGYWKHTPCGEIAPFAMCKKCLVALSEKEYKDIEILRKLISI
jgi:hypothetical protein